MTTAIDSRPTLRRYLEPCPDCGVRAMCGPVGSSQLTCYSCGSLTDLPEPIPAGDAKPLERPGYHPVVYYIRFGDRVKIGTTTDLEQRLRSLPYDEVLATESGTYDLEKRRHLQFRAARIYANREWFYMTDELRMHIAGLQRG